MSDYTSTPGIYVIIHVKSGKVYIGKTAVHLHRRWKNHRANLRAGRHANEHLQRAWNKYGEDAFRFQVLEYCPIERLNDREKHHIAIYKRRGMCFNIMDGGEGSPLSEETRKKLSEQHKGKKRPPFTDQARQNMSMAHKGLRFTDEHRRNLSNALKNRPPLSPETLRRMSEAQKGRHPTEESRRKMSESHKNISNETRQKISDAGKGRKHSEETRKRMSVIAKEREATKKKKRLESEQNTTGVNSDVCDID